MFCVFTRQPVHVPSMRNREKRLSVCRFQICAILKCHGNIQHAEHAMRHFETSQYYVCVTIVSIMPIAIPIPSAFCNLFASSIFSFLNLSYIKGWSGKYSVFLELLRCLCVQTAYSIILLLAQIWCLKPYWKAMHYNLQFASSSFNYCFFCFDLKC